MDPQQIRFKMDDVVKMKPHELPVTHSYVRAIVILLLRDLLLSAGVSEKNMGGKHVEFIGHEDLPNKAGPGTFKDKPWGKYWSSMVHL